MEEEKEETAVAEQPPEKKKEKPERNQEALVSTDDGEFAVLFDSAKFNQAWRAAKLFASSAMVPERYRDRPADCFIALDMADRLGMHPLMVMQNVYVVNGNPGMQAQLVIALTNRSNLFTGPLEWEVEGDDPEKQNYRVRAYATRKIDDKTLYGPWITWPIAKGEGWYDKKGSKWKTMPDQMFHYRAASWFVNRHCPEVKMGMPTTDELRDMAPAHVVKIEDTNPTKALADRLKMAEPEKPEGAKPDAPEPAGPPVERPTMPSGELEATQEPDDERAELAASLYETLATMGLDSVEIDKFVHLKTDRVAIHLLTKPQVEACIKTAGLFKGAEELRNYMKVEAEMKAKRGGQGELFKK